MVKCNRCTHVSGDFSDPPDQILRYVINPFWTSHNASRFWKSSLRKATVIFLSSHEKFGISIQTLLRATLFSYFFTLPNLNHSNKRKQLSPTDIHTNTHPHEKFCNLFKHCYTINTASINWMYNTIHVPDLKNGNFYQSENNKENTYIFSWYW